MPHPMKHLRRDVKDSERLAQRHGLPHLQLHRSRPENGSYQILSSQPDYLVPRYKGTWRGGGSFRRRRPMMLLGQRCHHAWVDGIDGELLQHPDWTAWRWSSCTESLYSFSEFVLAAGGGGRTRTRLREDLPQCHRTGLVLVKVLHRMCAPRDQDSNDARTACSAYRIHDMAAVIGRLTAEVAFLISASPKRVKFWKLNSGPEVCEPYACRSPHDDTLRLSASTGSKIHEGLYCVVCGNESPMGMSVRHGRRNHSFMLQSPVVMSRLRRSDLDSSHSRLA
jgi:hypothetical protein